LRRLQFRILRVCFINLMIFCTLFCGTCSAEDSTVTVLDLAIDVEGTTKVFASFTWEEYVEFLQSYDIPNADTYLKEEVKPKQILNVIYEADNVAAMIEIYEYANQTDAKKEWSHQATMGESYAWTTHYSIWHRFDSKEYLFQENRFMIFAIASPGCLDEINHDRAVELFDKVLDAFVSNLVEVMTNLFLESPPPSIEFTGEVVWGIQPGDIITWDYEDSMETVEIIYISDDNLAVLLGEPFDYYPIHCQEDYFSWLPAGGDQGPAELLIDRLSITHYDYYWNTADDVGLNVAGHPWTNLIYPLYRNGKYLLDMIESNVPVLFERSVEEEENYIVGRAKTTYSDDIPYSIQNYEYYFIRVHKGTGIVEYRKWDVDDKSDDVKFTTYINMTETNIDLGSRQPYVPQEDGDGSTTNGETDDGSGPTSTDGETDGTSQADSSTFIDSPLLLVGAVVAIVVIIVVVVAVVLLKKKK